MLLTKYYVLVLLLDFFSAEGKKSKKHNRTKTGIEEINKRLVEYNQFIDLEELLKATFSETFHKKKKNKCIAVISDTYYLDTFQQIFLQNMAATVSYFMIYVKEAEDLLSPNYKTLKVLQQIRKEGCGGYCILIANGIQAARLFQFGDRYRVLDTRAKYILFHNYRLFSSNLHYLWRRIINVVFIRRFSDNKHQNSTYIKHNSTIKRTGSYELSTVPFPAPIRGIFVPKRINIWRLGKFHMNKKLYDDKTADMKGQILRVATFQHVPATVLRYFNVSLDSSSDGLETEQDSNERSNMQMYSGIEVEMLLSLSKVMNFNPIIYEPDNAKEEQWGWKQIDGSFNGLLGEIMSARADVALGDLYYTPYYLELMDLTVPYNTECLTFLTPEALTDNSWMTLILPFKGYMWMGVVIGLFIGGFIFHVLARFHSYVESKRNNEENKSKTEIVPWVPPQRRRRLNRQTEIRRISLRKSSNVPSVYYPRPVNCNTEKNPEGLYLFTDLFNSFLYTYSMLLVVSLPKLPTGWSLRMLTGWYWLYCILIVVAYRASLTAILANPAPRVTIDTLQELADSDIGCGGWGDQIRESFQTSLDAAGQIIGSRFEKINNVDEAVEKVAKGIFAYYENIYFLKQASVRRQINLQAVVKDEIAENETDPNISKVKNERNLHIMSNCVINMPISLGLQKNSPLKPRADKFLRRVIEAGLVQKWLNDVMTPILNSEITQDDASENKALMSLKKLYGAFVALGIGYLISVVMLTLELVYWNFIVKKKPDFDKYFLRGYYAKSIKN